MAHHAAGLVRLTKNAKLARDLKADYTSADLTPRQRGMLDYAAKLTRAPGAMREDDVIALRALGFADRDILDINQVTAYFAYVNRVADGLGVVTDDYAETENQAIDTPPTTTLETMMTSFSLPNLPAELRWHIPPLDWSLSPDGALSIQAGPKTDLFNDPAGTIVIDNAPCALMTPPDPNFILSAKVSVGFGATYDAGALQIRVSDSLWGKLCFEYSPQGQPMVVSVVNRGVSDDCNSVVIAGSEVYLRVARTPRTLAFHYSTDGRLWHFVRYFSLGLTDGVRAGFSAQSPTGAQCRAVFTEITYRPGMLADNRNGE